MTDGPGGRVVLGMEAFRQIFQADGIGMAKVFSEHATWPPSRPVPCFLILVFFSPLFRRRRWEGL